MRERERKRERKKKKEEKTNHQRINKRNASLIWTCVLSSKRSEVRYRLQLMGMLMGIKWLRLFTDRARSPELSKNDKKSTRAFTRHSSIKNRFS
jgi:hypothetical protein